MNIIKTRREPFTVLSVAGDFDVRHSTEFKDCLTGLFKNGEYRIIVDLNEVSYIDSSGNGELINCYQECRKNEGKFIVVSKNEKVNQVLRKLKIHDTLNLCGEIEDAIRIGRG
ncbi:MAG: STAS domain-containing protein [bacterium]|nr:STAS domain-containing protein [bacterium]